MSPNPPISRRNTDTTSLLEHFDPAEIQAIRESLGISRPVMACFMGVCVSAVRDWEKGRHPPLGASNRMLQEIKHNPQYFLGRLKELVEVTDV